MSDVGLSFRPARRSSKALSPYMHGYSSLLLARGRQRPLRCQVPQSLRFVLLSALYPLNIPSYVKGAFSFESDGALASNQQSSPKPRRVLLRNRS